jgi:Ala-tRNA(Pro) deacylase
MARAATGVQWQAPVAIGDPIMSIARTVRNYLEQRQVRYDVVPHTRTLCSMETAAAAHVPGDNLAKSIILKDETGYVMAVVPSTHRLELGQLHRALHRPVGLATEAEIAELFRDCDYGAVPALGPAYGMMTLMDDSLVERPEIYFEAGDHEELIRVNGDQFANLMAGAHHGRFSQHV